jgi:hypothetical protein
LWPYLAGIVAESICCQMLWRHSLASLDEAVRTIFGEPNEASENARMKVLKES